MRASEVTLSPRATLLAFGLTVLLLAAPVPAQQQNADPAALQQALSRAQGLLRQLSEQRTRLEAENAAAQVAIANLERKLAREKRQREELDTELELATRKTQSLDTRLGNTSSRLEQTEERLRDTIEKYKALAAEHRATLAAKADVEDTLATTAQALADAQARNEELYAINAEILTEFKRKGSWEAFLQREPVLGLKQVEIENIEQDLRHRNEDQRLNVEVTDAKD
ncbi:MAG: hypothetical protein WD928_05770 [Gammaproteobacteria bacterium]